MWTPPAGKQTDEQKGLYFCISRWSELFNQHTPDSYQPRVCNIPFIVSEINHTAGLARENEAWGKHISLLQGELSCQLNQVLSLNILTPRQQYAINNITSEKCPQKIWQMAQAMSLDGFEEKYEKKATEAGLSRIIEIISSGAKEKSRLNDWLGQLATIALHKNSIIQQRGIIDSVPTSKEALVSAIKASMTHKEEVFKCTITVSFEKEKNEHKEAFIKVLNGINKEFSITPLPNPSNPEEISISKNIKATQQEAAIEQFMEQIQNAINMLTIYTRQPIISKICKAFITKVDGTSTEVSMSKPRLREIPAKSTAEKLTISALKSPNIDQNIANAIELYSISINTEDSRVKFITLWSALECLSNSMEGTTIINKASNLVTSITLSRRTEKQSRHLAYCMHELIKKHGISEIPQSMKLSSLSKICAEDILEALTSQKDSPPIRNLLSLASNHPYLTWRLFDSWERLQSPSYLKTELKNSKERMHWHIWRIYRARNLLIHGGIEVAHISHLYDSLHYYFITTITRLIHEATLIGTKQCTIRDIAHIATSNAGYVLEQLEHAPQTLYYSDFLVNANSSVAHTSLWPDAKPSNAKSSPKGAPASLSDSNTDSLKFDPVLKKAPPDSAAAHDASTSVMQTSNNVQP